MPALLAMLCGKMVNCEFTYEQTAHSVHSYRLREQVLLFLCFCVVEVLFRFDPCITFHGFSFIPFPSIVNGIQCKFCYFFVVRINK